ncbi:PAS and ANTAR domain-containing protein [Paenarthrobacter sp. CAP02]|uniref:PAS and ANTAR domain-containing protein n=1 Tax=Paenarthrobacter sp. CAP02 TaxID=3158144 RepID=UPI0032D9C723
MAERDSRISEGRVSYGFPLPDGEVCPTGSFRLSVQTGKCKWSDGLFRIHAYSRGEVVPTKDLILAHKHPEDRDASRQFIAILARDGGQGSNFHRIIDSKGKEHRVLTVAEADWNEKGQVASIHGLMIDLTRAIAIESGHAAAAALVNAYASRELIEQAKGILMASFNLSPSAAFDLLSRHSQNTNTKLAVLAAGLVASAEHGRIQQVLRAWAT